MDFASEFDWHKAPFNSFAFALTTSLIYLFSCIVHYAVYGSNPQELFIWKILKGFIPMHNLILCFGSLIMFIGIFREVVLRSFADGSVEWLLCESETTQPIGTLWFWSYIYYLSKYYELLDTLLQLARGKYPPHSFLHAYHHGGVILMSWVWIDTAATMQFVGSLFNTLVHVLMYYYFYLKTQNIEPKWKSLLTSFQIIQFLISLVCFIITMYLVNGLGRKCKGMPSVYGSILFNVTLLYGFFNVLHSTPKVKRTKDH